MILSTHYIVNWRMLKDFTGAYRVCMGHGKPGKSWNFTI